MIFVNLLNVVSSAVYLLCFFFLGTIKIRTREHHILKLAALALFQWNILAYFVYNSTNPNLLKILLPVSCLGMFFFFPLNLHFSYAVCFKKKLKPAAAAALYLPAAFLAAANFRVPVSMEISVAAGGAIDFFIVLERFVQFTWLLYFLVCWLVPIIFYVRFYRNTQLNREKRLAATLVRMIIITAVLLLGDFFVLSALPDWNIPPQSPLLLCPWALTMVYSTWKYGFLRISPGLATDKILESIEDLVLLYDLKGQTVFMNKKAKKTLISGNTSPPGKQDLTAMAVDPLISGIDTGGNEKTELNTTLHIPDTSEDKKLRVDLKSKLLFDRFSDPLGVMVTGSIVPGLLDILKSYRLTDREAEVMEYLLKGWTSKNTAEALNITERTVKAHISAVYEKTGAANRVELINLFTAP